MAKFLKYFTNINDRQSYENSNDYLEPYVSIIKENGGEVSNISYNLVPAIILTMADSSVKKIYRTNSFDGTKLPYYFPNLEFYNITNIQLSDKITEIKYVMFFENLKSINIPDSVTSISDSAFTHCPNLQSITIPVSIKRIEESTFDSCTGLTSVTLTDSITYIGGTAFFSDDNIHELKIIGKKDISNLLPSELTNNLVNLYVDASLVETYKTYRDSIGKTFEVKPLT